MNFPGLRLELGGFPDICEPMPRKPNGRAAEPTNASVARSKPWKPKPSNHSTQTYSPIPSEFASYDKCCHT